MKRKFILLPITLTALAPAIGLVSCNEPEPTPTDEIIIDDFVYNTDFAFLEKYISLEKNKKYCFVLKAKDFLLSDLSGVFRLSFYLPHTWTQLECIFGYLNLEIDNKYLNFYGYCEDYTTIESGYGYSSVSHSLNKITHAAWKHFNTSENSVIKIHLMLLENLDNVWIISGGE